MNEVLRKIILVLFFVVLYVVWAFIGTEIAEFLYY